MTLTGTKKYYRFYCKHIRRYRRTLNQTANLKARRLDRLDVGISILLKNAVLPLLKAFIGIIHARRNHKQSRTLTDSLKRSRFGFCRNS
jgi:hypothetical protein